MEVLRLDHVHIKVPELEAASDAYDDVTGEPLFRGIDYTDTYGMAVSFAAFPIALEVMKVTDKTKQMAALYDAAPYGVFALSYKVENLDEACVQMEELGYKLLMRYEFGPVREALFDTKEKLSVYLEMVDYPGDSIAEAYAASQNNEAAPAAPAAAPAPAPAAPQTPQGKEKKMAGLSLKSKMKEILAREDAKAVLESFVPGCTKNPQLKLVGGMPIDKLAKMAPDMLPPEKLPELDAALQAMPE
ncbi:MAG: VOC family protein [Eggerthellaceae bacterium]|nr:VOC family protein [Eggerthellaceae bacterium]